MVRAISPLSHSKCTKCTLLHLLHGTQIVHLTHLDMERLTRKIAFRHFIGITENVKISVEFKMIVGVCFLDHALSALILSTTPSHHLNLPFCHISEED